MKRSEFEEKIVRVTKEKLDANLKLVGSKSINLFENSGLCPNCGDELNHRKYPAEAWSHVIDCRRCDSILLIYEADRMGTSIPKPDAMLVYKDK
jgi:hypothetical protein